MMESMMNNMIDNNVDLVVCNIKYIYDNSEKVKYNQKDKVLDKYEAMQEYIKDGIVQAVAWNKLYKRNLINGMRYKVGKINEDEFFTYKIVDRINKIYYNSKPFYNYVQRNTSIMGLYSIKRLDAVEASYERLNFIKERYPELYVEEKKNFINLCIFNYEMILKNINIDYDKNGRNILKDYIKKIRFKNKELSTYCLKDKIKIIMSKISLNYCCRILMIFRDLN